MKIKKLAKTALAVAPLLVGTATPAYGCLVLPDSPGVGTSADPGPAAQHSDQIVCGPVGCGPDAPMDALTAADDNPGQGFTCDPMCITGNPEQEGGPR
ncbi:MAG: hypothetical protein M3N31_06630 [Actinomycetota bacterium]|nr:hypothetical protein [Actinomycetota bacterium]